MKALWFGGAVSAGTGLWSHWFITSYSWFSHIEDHFLIMIIYVTN